MNKIAFRPIELKRKEIKLNFLVNCSNTFLKDKIIDFTGYVLGIYK
jgi:hypothetical protein